MSCTPRRRSYDGSETGTGCPKADIGKSCVRIRQLADVDRDVLTDLIHAGATFFHQDGERGGAAVTTA